MLNCSDVRLLNNVLIIGEFRPCRKDETIDYSMKGIEAGAKSP